MFCIRNEMERFTVTVRGDMMGTRELNLIGSRIVKAGLF